MPFAMFWAGGVVSLKSRFFIPSPTPRIICKLTKKRYKKKNLYLTAPARHLRNTLCARVVRVSLPTSSLTVSFAHSWEAARSAAVLCKSAIIAHTSVVCCDNVVSACRAFEHVLPKATVRPFVHLTLMDIDQQEAASILRERFLRTLSDSEGKCERPTCTWSFFLFLENRILHRSKSYVCPQTESI